MNETTEPEQVRRDIARTRADMDHTLAELEDRVSPTRIKERQTARVRSRLQRTRESVMGQSGGGSSDGPGMKDRVSSMADDASGAVQHAPDRAEELTRGNPLAAGLVALGVGALAGSLLPSTRAERALATELRDEFEEPLRHEFEQSSHQMQSELKEHAQQAVEETKQTVQEGVEHTTDQARSAAQDVGDHAKDSAQNVRG